MLLLMKNFCLWVISNETFHDSLSVYGWTSCQVSSKLVVRFQRYSVPWYTGTFIYYLKCDVTLYLWDLTTNFDETWHEVHPYTDSGSWKVSFDFTHKQKSFINNNILYREVRGCVIGTDGHIYSHKINHNSKTVEFFAIFFASMIA